MRPRCSSAAAVRWLVGLPVLLSIGLVAGAAPEMQADWPRVTFRDGVTNTVYQPQLQSWDYSPSKQFPPSLCNRKARRTGVRHDLIQRKNAGGPWPANVFLEQVEITQGLFPSAGPQAQTYLATLRSLLPEEVQSISLDHLEASLRFSRLVTRQPPTTQE